MKLKLSESQLSGLNRTFVDAYKDSIETAGNETLDFADVIWKDDIAEIVEICRKFGIKEFTVSVMMGNLINALEEFENRGFKIDGLTKVKARYKNWRTGEQDIVPAIKLKAK